MMFAATFQKPDYIEFLKAVESDAEAGTTLVETYGKGSGTFLTFGACDEIKAALEKWNTLLPTMGLQMDCSIGGVDHDGICGCTIDSFYGSTADRNAAQQQFGKLVAVCKQNNVMTFCTIDRGDCGLRMIFVAPSCAVWKAVNDSAAADPDFGEIAVGKAMTAKATAFGSITTDYYKELFGWSQTTPVKMLAQSATWNALESTDGAPRPHSAPGILSAATRDGTPAGFMLTCTQ